MARVEVRLYASLRTYHPGEGAEPLQVAVSPGETVGDLRLRIGIPSDEVSVVFVNSRRVGFDHPLCPEDRVAMFPLVAGG